MVKPAETDIAAAHKFFAADCFNKAWDLIEKPDRSPQDDRLMVALNQASIYHWLQRDDCTQQHLSVGYWQASRIQAMLANPAEAVRLGEVCLSYSRGLKPFYLGYAHEALARAYKLAANEREAAQHLKAAQDLAAQVGDSGERQYLVSDLAQLTSAG